MMLRSIMLASLVAVLSSPALAQRGPASVFAEPVKEREFAMRIEALGTLEPNERVDLTLNAADRVTAIFFDDGQRVEEGKTLLSLAQREQVALVEAAEATVEEARRQLERVRRLVDSEAVSRSELDEAQRNMDNAAAQLRAVQSRQRDRVLVAPFDGVLGFRQVSVGSYIRPGDVVATLIDDSEMNLDFSIPSVFLRVLKSGAVIETTTDDVPGTVFSGEVASLDNSIDPVTRAVRVRATLPNPDQVLKAGMFMQVTLLADPRRALSIPEEAIQPVGPDNFVFVATDADGGLVATRRQIEIGARQAGFVEVTSGLGANDRIITEGVIGIREGSSIVIQEKTILSPDRISGRASPDTVSVAPGR
ncbi:MAG: efflux RND transporter periplasmic adaptor subunit [Pseudomonadota bacterium]